MKGSGQARRLAVGAMFALAATAAAPFANADTLIAEASPLISGTQSNVYTLAASSAGSVTVSLSNLGWPDRLSSLSFALATSSGVLKTFSGEGTQTINIGTAGTYYAIVTGTAQGHWNLGMYSLRMTFAALSGPGGPTVPLPAAGWLLLSGIAGVFGLMRWKQELPASLVTA
jgi:hypothetical protein